MLPVRVKSIDAVGILVDTHIIPGEQEGFGMDAKKQLIAQRKVVPVCVGIVAINNGFVVVNLGDLEPEWGAMSVEVNEPATAEID